LLDITVCLCIYHLIVHQFINLLSYLFTFAIYAQRKDKMLWFISGSDGRSNSGIAASNAIRVMMVFSRFPVVICSWKPCDTD